MRMNETGEKTHPVAKKTLIESYRLGYFDHPRMLNAGELAENIGIKKSTLPEHIHKAEK